MSPPQEIPERIHCRDSKKVDYPPSEFEKSYFLVEDLKVHHPPHLKSSHPGMNLTQIVSHQYAMSTVVLVHSFELLEQLERFEEFSDSGY